MDHAGLHADLGAKMAGTRSHTPPTCAGPLQTTRASLLIWRPRWLMPEIKREPEAEIKRLATQVWMLIWQPRWLVSDVKVDPQTSADAGTE